MRMTDSDAAMAGQPLAEGHGAAGREAPAAGAEFTLYYMGEIDGAWRAVGGLFRRVREGILGNRVASKPTTCRFAACSADRASL